MKYKDDEGRLYVVSTGIGKRWMTVRKQSEDSPGSKRVKSKYLPLRNHREEAEADLKQYAERKKYTEVQ